MTDLIVIGGGLNGPVLALAAAQAGFAVTLVDPAPRTAPPVDGRAYAISHGSMRVLRAVGIWDALADAAQPMERIEVRQGRAGEAPGFGRVDFDGREIEERPMGVMIEDRALRAALWDRLHQLDWRDGLSVVDHDATLAGAQVRLSDGSVLTAPLIAGCDGRRSETAQRAGLARVGRDYDQSAVVCTVGHSVPHQGTAVQVFLSEGPLAVLPLTDDRCQIVWSAQTDRAALLMRLGDDAFLAHLSATIGGRLGDLTMARGRSSYPLDLTLAKAVVAERLVLVGDAGHGVHPVAGQGLNAGLRDVAGLIDIIVEARGRGEDIGSALVLARYARWRGFDIASLAAATDGVIRLFSADGLAGLRGLGMAAINAAGPARRAMVREAAGLTGELPRLMR